MNRICEFSVVLVTLPIMLFTGTQAANVSSIQARVAAAEDTSYEFLTRLGGQLKRELADGGPESAISVCRDVAPAMANGVVFKKWLASLTGEHQAPQFIVGNARRMGAKCT